MALSLSTMMRIGFRLITYRGEIEALLPQVNKAVEETMRLVPQVRDLLLKIAPEFFGPSAPGAPDFGVRWLQSGLKTLGFDPGPIDGDIGPRTIAAVRAFQQRHGLVVDGLPGPATEAKLDELLTKRA